MDNIIINEISTLRISGLLIGGFLFLFGFIRLRRHNYSKSVTSFALLSAIALIAVSIFPELANLPVNLFEMEKFQGGRLLSILIIVVAILWFLILRERAKLDLLQGNFDKLVRSLALDQLTVIEKEALGSDIWVVIPVFNEAGNLAFVLPDIPKQINGKSIHILVVDDGSTDNSSSVAIKYGASILKMPINSGGGMALLASFTAATKAGAEFVVTMDGDGQHLPEELPRLLHPLLNNEADLVIGSRIIGNHEAASISRAIGVYVFSWLINILLGTRITDCASGYRAISTKLLNRLILKQQQYHTAELIIESAKRESRIKEVPITICRRRSGTSKKGGIYYMVLIFYELLFKRGFDDI